MALTPEQAADALVEAVLAGEETPQWPRAKAEALTASYAKMEDRMASKWDSDDDEGFARYLSRWRAANGY